MTVVGVVGRLAAGKNTFAEYLCTSQGFTLLKIRTKSSIHKEIGNLCLFEQEKNVVELETVEDTISHITKNWQINFVILDIDCYESFLFFEKRPYFIIVNVDAPLLKRFKSSNQKELENFIAIDEKIWFAQGINKIAEHAKYNFYNNSNIADFKKCISSIDFKCTSVHRPDWDRYFMSLAILASKRTNCMKRCVGCVIVRDKRIISTGYNGTARGTLNCCDGGCQRCNSNTSCGHSLQHCYCLHAEANALMEAGRDRCEGATLYCTTAPCLGCSQKIVQCGIRKVIYSREYSIEHNASELLNQANVERIKLETDEKFIISTKLASFSSDLRS